MSQPSIRLVTQWPTSGDPASAPGARRLFVPALDRFAPELREIVGLLPVTDINGGLVSALGAAPAGAGAGLVAGIFGADPFLDMAELVARLGAAGIRQVANFPTVQHFDGATAEGLAAVGYDLDAEIAVLRRLAAAGLEPIGYAASAKAAETVLAAGIATIAYHPGPPPVPSSERGALAKIRLLAAASGARVLVHETVAARPAQDHQPIRP